MRNFWTILKKELKRIFTDKRILAGIIVPALMIFVLYTVMGEGIKKLENDNKPYVVYVENSPEGFNEMIFDNLDNPVKINPNKLTEEEIMTGVEEKDIDLYIIYEENFLEKAMNYEATGKAPYVKAYYNTSKIKSQKIFLTFDTVISSLEQTIINKNAIDFNPAGNQYDLATEESLAKMFISSLVPMLLISILVSSAFMLSADMVAGEKERGTLATMLVTPVNRTNIILGKSVAMTITTLLSSSLNFLALMASLPSMMPENVGSISYGFGTISGIFGLVIITSILFTIIALIISTYAKTVKEANSISGPIIGFVTLVAMTGLLTEGDLNSWLFLIPAFNNVQSFKMLLSGDFVPLSFIITICCNLLLIGLGIVLLVKMFKTEKIMTNE